MSNYSSLKTTINANVKTNGNQEITGSIMNTVLLQMVDILGAGFQYMGVANESTNPGTPDNRVAYLAGPGSYPHFGNGFIPDECVGVFTYDGEWRLQATDIGEKILTPVSFLSNQLYYHYVLPSTLWSDNGYHRHIAVPVTAGKQYKIEGGSETTTFAWLTSHPATNTGGTQAPVVSGTTVTTIPAGGTIYVEAPATANFMCIRSGNTNTGTGREALPAAIYLSESRLDEIERDLDNLDGRVTTGLAGLSQDIATLDSKFMGMAGNATFAAIASNNVKVNADNASGKFTTSGAFFIYAPDGSHTVPQQEINYAWGTQNRLYFALVVSADYTTISMVEHDQVANGSRLIAFVRRTAASSQAVDLIYGSTGLVFTINGKNQLTSLGEVFGKADANMIRVKTNVTTAVDDPEGVRIRVLMAVKAGQRIWARTSDPTGLNCGVWNTIANAVRATDTGKLQVISSGYTPGFGDTLITRDGYIGISLTNGTTAISDQRKQEMIDALEFAVGTGLYYETSNLVNEITVVRDEVENPLPKSHVYFGERIKLDNSFDFSIYASNGMAGQSGACFGDYLFIVTDRLTKVACYNLKSKAMLYTLTTGITSETSWHCNQTSFSTKYYDSADMFPVMYISMQNGSDGRCQALGYRIIPTLTDGEISSFTIELAQTVKLPVMTDQNCLGNVNITFDTQNGHMWGYGRNNNSEADNYNKAMFARFAIPELSESEVVLEDSDILEAFPDDWSMLYAQGGFIRNGKLVIMQGYQNAGFIYCRVIDLYCAKRMVSLIDLLANGFTQEPEGVFFYNGKIMTSANSVRIYQFDVM